MPDKTYSFRINGKFFKQGYYMTDDKGEMVYEAKMTKFTLFMPYKFEFINHITTKSEEHKVGHTITIEESGFEAMLSTNSYFKFDGKKIWDYLHEIGVRISSGVSDKKIGMTYDISLKGEKVATIAMASVGGKKSIITTRYNYDITTSEEHIPLAFLVAFSFARTNQIFYD